MRMFSIYRKWLQSGPREKEVIDALRKRMTPYCPWLGESLDHFLASKNWPAIYRKARDRMELFWKETGLDESLTRSDKASEIGAAVVLEILRITAFNTCLKKDGPTLLEVGTECGNMLVKYPDMVSTKVVGPYFGLQFVSELTDIALTCKEVSQLLSRHEDPSALWYSAYARVCETNENRRAERVADLLDK